MNYRLVNAEDKDIDILTSMKLVTMIDEEMDNKLSFTEKNKLKKNIYKNIELTCENYKLIYIGKNIIGAYLVVDYKDGKMIDQIFLFEEYRNNGIGTNVIKSIIEEYDNLYIWVYKNNQDALRLFERLGFFAISRGRTMILRYNKAYIYLKEHMDNIKLGYCDKDGNLYGLYSGDFKDNFYLQNPKQIVESGVGSCFDQVEYERYLMDQINEDCRTYYIIYPNDKMDIGHTFLIYKDKVNYYWFENAWLKYKGIHIYKNKEALFDDILNKFVKTIPSGDFNKVKLFLYEKPRFGIGYSKFLASCVKGRGIKIK